MFDFSRFDHWQAEGGLTLGDRVKERVKLLRAERNEPVLADGVRKHLDELVDSVVRLGR
jgi:trimethylamine:corrinoid methyltransferase-like protein